MRCISFFSSASEMQLIACTTVVFACQSLPVFFVTVDISLQTNFETRLSLLVVASREVFFFPTFSSLLLLFPLSRLPPTPSPLMGTCSLWLALLASPLTSPHPQGQ